METNLKKLLSVLGAVCLSIASVNADDRGDRNCCSPCPQTREKMQPPSRTAVPPGKYQTGEDSPCLMVSAAYTLWTARQDGLAYAVSGFNPTNAADVCCGNVCYPKSKLRSGFKVDLGTYLCHDGWDAVATYTWFYNKRNGFTSCCFTEGTLYSTWAVRPFGTCCTTAPFNCDMLHTQRLNQACARFNNWFNRIDATLGRTFYAGHYHTLRVFLGLLGAWDKQNFDINYLPTCLASEWSLWRNSQKWWGVGPYAGFSPTFIFPQWCGDSQWSIFLDAGIALPWSKANARHRFFTTPFIASGSGSGCVTDCCPTTSCCPDTNCNTCCETNCCEDGCKCVEPGCDSPMYICYNNIYWNVMPMLELALGLRWETWFECNWNFLLQAAWEEQVYFDHNYFFSIGDNPRGNGNYSMQGLTVKAIVGF